MDIQLDQDMSIVYIKPNGKLTEDDFLKLAATVDPIIQQQGHLKGLVIETMGFPGWANIPAFMAHVKFIKQHQAHIRKIAIVTNSKFADIARKGIGPFVKPQIKHFPYDQVASATKWVQE